MAEASVAVELFNPGQVFACLGLLEAADTLLGDALGGFDWRDEADVRFIISANGEDDPIEFVLQFLRDASIYSYAPTQTGLSTNAWGVETRTMSWDNPFPFPLPTSPATLPTVFVSQDESQSIEINYWGDNRGKTLRDNAKFWAGAA